MNLAYLTSRIKASLRPKNKRDFIMQMNDGGSILDVGCGNSTVVRIKQVKPRARYTGIDVGDYNQSSEAKALCHRYLIVAPERFSHEIRALETFDYIICSHNLEHCDDPFDTLDALLSRVAPGGRVYIATPSQASLRFPHRKGTLNFHDDTTHRSPIDSGRVLDVIQKNGLRLDVFIPRYRPLAMMLAGLLLEPFSAISRRNLYGTWELYGFETVIWATRPAR